MQIHERIKALREQRGLSQEALALQVGYRDRSSIAKVEAGKVDLSQSKIAAFAAALAAPSDEEATAHFIRCEEILSETAANVYIQDLCDLVAVRKGITGYRFYPLYAIDLSTLTYT